MSDRSTLTDSQIMRETFYSDADDKGRRQMKFKLPSGRIIKSEYLVPDQVKGKVLIAWAEALRAEDTADLMDRQSQELAARAEKRAREASLLAHSASDTPAPAAPGSTRSPPSGSLPAGSASTSTASSPKSTELPDDPTDAIVSKLRGLFTVRDEQERQLKELTSSLESTRASIAAWTRVAEALVVDRKSLVTSQESTNELVQEVPTGHSAVSLSGSTDPSGMLAPSPGRKGGRARGPHNRGRRRAKDRVDQQLADEPGLQEGSGGPADVAG